MDAVQVCALGLAYLVVGTIIAGLMRRVEMIDDIEEGHFQHVWWGLFWPAALLLILLIATVGLPLSWLYRQIAGRS